MLGVFRTAYAELAMRHAEASAPDEASRTRSRSVSSARTGLIVDTGPTAGPTAKTSSASSFNASLAASADILDVMERR